jgi:Ca2+-transporting ATPase
MARQGSHTSTLARGLTSEQARERLRAFGPNRIARQSLASRLGEIASTFADPMALMLAAASATYHLLGEETEAVVLLAALVPVLAIDVILEARARGALKRLAAAVSPRAVVIRDGVETEIDTEGMVPGDLMLVSEGGVVHADGVLRAGSNLALDESQLSGEAEPRPKEPAPAEVNAADAPASAIVYAGSRVLAGHGWAEVTATGPRTSYGDLARLVAEAASRPTPSQRKTSAMVRGFVALAAVASAGLFALSFARGIPPARAFLFAVSLAMSSVSEEFLIVLTMFLSLGAWRLGRHGVLVKRLAGVETLGATTVICVDKTGTLTAGDFTLTSVLPSGSEITELRLLENALFACEPVPADSIDKTIVSYCAARGLDVDEVRSRWDLVHDYPFDLVGKHMTHVWRERGAGDGARLRIAAKGALEGVLEHCDIPPALRARIQAANSDLASRGIRVLAIAGRESTADAASLTGIRDEDEKGLVLHGLLGFNDPMRPEVPAAIAECRRAGVRLMLITGDHALTAHAIADASGLAHGDDGIISGPRLDRLDPAEFDAAVRRCAIFARIRPEQKYAIVDSLERAGEIVAMTGDGVNDAPAMRRADIAISMGRRATEIARSVADLVLLEDNFAAMVATIREGRRIYSNIQRAFRYLIGFKLMLVLAALIPPLANLPILLFPVDLVWLELIVHPVSALAFERGEDSEDAMAAPPRDPASPLIDRPSALRAGLCGALLALGAVAVFRLRLPIGENYARAAAMSVIVAGSLMMVWAEWAGRRPWRRVKLPAQLRFWIVVGCVALSLPAFVMIKPIADLLMLSPLAPSDWLLALMVAILAVCWRAPGSSSARGKDGPG